MAELKTYTVELEIVTTMRYEFEIEAKTAKEAERMAENRERGPWDGDVQDQTTEVLDCYESDD